MESTELFEYISATKIRLRKLSPFFAALSLYAEIDFSNEVQLAATNGKKIIFNPITYIQLPPSERDGVFLHELLHMALLHHLRRGVRDHYIFNIAADIVVNGMIVNEGNFKIPKYGIRDEDLEHLSVEEVYELIIKNKKKYNLNLVDLINDEKDSEDKDSQGKGNDLKTGISDLNTEAEIRNYWKQAINDAKLITKGSSEKSLPESFERNFGEVLEPEIDWKTKLWNFLVRTPTDFGEFDRRLIYSGLYLENLEGESINVFCCIDTSGSISNYEISKFMREIKGIINAYPNLNCRLWYADHECYGPYNIDSMENVPKPKGGGGTDFEPFFKDITKKEFNNNDGVCIYLTDGYGYFPEKEPDLPVLWVVIPGGAEQEYFPFGEIVKLTN
jgi:predicted metal-dependent peptidase